MLQVAVGSGLTFAALHDMISTDKPEPGLYATADSMIKEVGCQSGFQQHFGTIMMPFMIYDVSDVIKTLRDSGRIHVNVGLCMTVGLKFVSLF